MNRPRAIRLALCLAAMVPASAAAPVQAITPAPTLRYPARPIAPRAQLDAYLRGTPAFALPLYALTTAGRQRLLADLTCTGPQQRDALRRRLAPAGLLHSSEPSRSSPSTDIR